jgi:hypothetical protein
MKLFARISATMPMVLVAESASAHGEEVIFRPITLSVIVLGVAFGAWAATRRDRLLVTFGQAVALHFVGLVAYFTLSQGWSFEALVLFGLLALFLGFLPLAAVFFATYAGLRLLSGLFRIGPRKSPSTIHEP